MERRRSTVKEVYWPRIVDSYVSSALGNIGAVLIEGPKGCGKTSTGRTFSKSEFRLQETEDPDVLKNIRSNPREALEGEGPRLIDGWQSAPFLWDGVRNTVDKENGNGMFILTGSSVPKRDGFIHSGTGRIARVLMRPMSLFESRESDGSVSLSSLFAGRDVPNGTSSLELEDLSRMLIRGGWPKPVTSGTYDGFFAGSYIGSVIASEIGHSDGVRRNADTARKILRSLSRHISTVTPLGEICEDVIVNGRPITPKTAQSYINAFASTFVYEELPAWNLNVRSKTAIRTTPKRQLVDPSLAAAVLGIDAEGLMKDFETFGPLFESMCIRDLRVYAQAVGGSVCFYRDRYGSEVDAVVHLPDGRWGAFEVKLGGAGIEAGAKSLLKIRELIDGRHPPSFLAVLTGTGSSYVRSDGVAVVPVGLLGP